MGGVPLRLAGAGPGDRPPGEPRLVGYLYLLPAFAVFSCFVLLPADHAAYLSLWELGRADGRDLGRVLELRRRLPDEELRSAFVHALVLLFFYAVLPLLIGLLLAGVMARARVRGLALFRTILFLPQVVAMVVVARDVEDDLRPRQRSLNRFLGLFGIEGKSWLGDFSLALPSIGLDRHLVYFGLAMVLLTAGVQKIPSSLYDAARVDGAGAVPEFLAVTLPGLRGEFAVALTLTTIYALRNFDLVYITTSGGPGDSTTVPAFQVFTRAFESGQVGIGGRDRDHADGDHLRDLGWHQPAPERDMTSRNEQALGYTILASSSYRVVPIAGTRPDGVEDQLAARCSAPSTACTSATSRTRGRRATSGPT